MNKKSNEQKSKPLRARDIAKAAGVSPSVVSSFFNDKFNGRGSDAIVGIGKQTQQRILGVCRDKAYMPKDQRLHALIYPEKTDICFLLSDQVEDGLENSFFSLILEGVLDAAERNGNRVTYGRFQHGADYLQPSVALPQRLDEGFTRMVVVAGPVNYSLLLALQKAGIAVVYVSRHAAIQGITSVVPDYNKAGYLGVQTLVEAKHQNIVLVGDSYFTPDSYNFIELFNGATEALNDFKCPSEDRFIRLPVDLDKKRTQLLSMVKDCDPDATALFCFDDWTARLALSAMAAAGLKVPDDFSVMGCNDDRDASITVPSLATVHLPVRRVGRKAVETLLRTVLLVDTSNVQPRIILPVEQVIRESVGAPSRILA